MQQCQCPACGMWAQYPPVEESTNEISKHCSLKAQSVGTLPSKTGCTALSTYSASTIEGHKNLHLRPQRGYSAQSSHQRVSIIARISLGVRKLIAYLDVARPDGPLQLAGADWVHSVRSPNLLC